MAEFFAVYPAAHSMDTHWFAVVQDGHVEVGSCAGRAQRGKDGA
jgi:hypothetical protein